MSVQTMFLGMKTSRMLREIGRLQKRMERMLEWRGPRMVVAHPDLCLYMSSIPDFGFRYLIKIGAKKGHLCISFGWIRATIAW